MHFFFKPFTSWENTMINCIMPIFSKRIILFIKK
nr:MAG TPA: hypothetical protein [Bacteriophage sp.]